MNQHSFVTGLILTVMLVQMCYSATLYNTGTSTYRNQTWMTNLDYGLPIREISILGTRNSMQTMECWWNFPPQKKQSNSIQNQLESGIRALDVRFKHNNNKFDLYDRPCSLGKNFDDVLVPVKNFLATYPGETVLLHLVEQQSASGCTRTIQDTFKSYRESYPGLFWTPSSQDPQLGQVRGMIVLLQQFNAVQIHGLLWATFNVLPSKQMGTNWDLYDAWVAVKNFAAATNTAKKSRIAYWTGQGGSYPYFVASGKSSMDGNRLATGLTTPGFSSSYPDFPRVTCVWIFVTICTIAFEGLNILGYNYVTSQNFAYTGIIYVDFYGDDLIIMAINKNKATYAKCTSTQTSQGCTLCQINTGVCLKCNTNMNYVYDSVNKICLAKTGYYLNASYIPQLCAGVMPGCLECTDATTCIVCDTINHYNLSASACVAATGYYLNATFFPVPCPQVGCYQCSDDIICTTCSVPTNYIMNMTTGYTCQCDDLSFFMQAPSTQACICMPTYFLSANSTCDPMPKCPDMTGGCLNCSVADICMECDAANNFTFDPNFTYCVCQPLFYFTGSTCALCNTADAACDQCANANLCLSCVDNFTLTTGVCKCNYQYFLVDNDTCNLCEVGCLVCTGIGSCTICDASNFYTLASGYCECVVGRFQSNGSCIPCGAMAGCLDCNSGGCIQCQPIFGFHLNGTVCQCDPDYFVNDMQVCQQCLMDGCMNCISQAICTQCDPAQFFLTPTGFCDDICGDGKKIYAQCDDGNTVNGDGCSSQCKLETDYTCIGGSRTTPDSCSYSGPFYLTVTQTIKDQKKNKIYIKSTIKPNILALQTMNFSAVVNPTFSIDQKQVTFDPATGTISMQVSYAASLNSLSSNNLQVSFDPPTIEPAFYFMKTASFYLPQVTDNNLALKYYDDSIYGLLQLMKTITNVTAFLYLGVFLICFLFISKLIAIQLILVPQVAFAGLIMIERLEALLQPMSNLYLTNGYNPLFKDTNPLPPRLSVLNYGGQFLTNFNICAVVALMPFIVGLSLLIVSKVRKSQKIQKYSYKSLKQWFFSFLLAFQFQFTLALGIDMQFGTSMIGKVLGGIFVAILVIFLLIFYKKPDHFGQFKKFFIQSPVSLNFYIAVVLFRIILALDLIMMSQSSICGFIAIGLVGMYTIILMIIRPYLKNIRPILNMIVMVAILIIQAIYKLNFYSPQATFITSYLPLFIVGLLLFLLLANIIFIVINLRQKLTKGKIDKYQKNDEIDDEFKKQFDRQLSVINQIQLALNSNNLVNMKQRDKDEMELQGLRIQGYQELKMRKKDLNISLSGSSMNEQSRFIYEEI